LLGFEGAAWQAVNGLTGDAPHPCGAPSGYYPRSLRYSVRQRAGRSKPLRPTPVGTATSLRDGGCP